MASRLGMVNDEYVRRNTVQADWHDPHSKIYQVYVTLLPLENRQRYGVLRSRNNDSDDEVIAVDFSSVCVRVSVLCV